MNWDDVAFTTRAGDDTYNIASNARLTIDTDTRYCQYSDATKGCLGAVTLNNAATGFTTGGGEVYIDGTKVRLIPYDTGSGVVPAYPATITQGAVSAVFLGVWSAFNVAPTAIGAAVPTTGYIKVKNVTGGTFTAGALTGIGANATGPDTVGWIEVLGVETRLCSLSRPNLFTAQGAWFEHSTLVTTGNAATTYQLPASLANTHYAGCEVETAPGSGEYDIYPSAGTMVGVNTVSSDVYRGKVCWISSQGLLRFGTDGTNLNGLTPASGCKIRVPNVLLLNCTIGTLNVNTAPNATLATRYEFASTGGLFSFDKVASAWYMIFSLARGVTITNSMICEHINPLRLQSKLILTRVCVGQSAAVAQNALVMSALRYGADITDCVFTRATLPSGGVMVLLSTTIGVTITRCRLFGFLLRSTTNIQCFNSLQDVDLTITDCLIGTAVGYSVTQAVRARIYGTQYFDSLYGTTNIATNNLDVVAFGASNDNVIFDGLSYPCGPMTGPRQATFTNSTGDSRGLVLQNIGTYAAPLETGSPLRETQAWSRITTTATVTSVAHGLKAGDLISVVVSDVVAAIVIGAKTVVAAPTADTFTFACLDAGVTSGFLSYYGVVSINFFTGNGGTVAFYDTLIQRVYITHSSFFAVDTSWDNVTIHNSGTDPDALSGLIMNAQNSHVRGCFGGQNLAVGQGGITGTHFIDSWLSRLSPVKTNISWTRSATVGTFICPGHQLRSTDNIVFTDSTDNSTIRPTKAEPVTVIDVNTFTCTVVAAGATSGTCSFENLGSRINVMCHEPSQETLASGEVTIDAGNPKFTGAGGVMLNTIGDQVTWMTNEYLIGHTGFPVVFNQAAANPLDSLYQIDKNDGQGFSGWRNAGLQKTGCATVSGSFTVTMTDTTGIIVGDYVFRDTNLNGAHAPKAKVVSIDSPTQVTLDLANVGTVSGMQFAFNGLFNEVVNAQLGMKLKFRLRARATNTTTTTTFGWSTTSTDVTRAYQYPLILAGPYRRPIGVTHVS